MKEENIYRKYSSYLVSKYGEKVYKLPLNLPLTCPNRDGNIDHVGCTFCGEKGAGHESLDDSLSIEDQLKANQAYIAKRYKAKKYIAYLQNFSNTYMPLELFEKRLKKCIVEGVVEIAISTRPDCIREEYLKFLNKFREEQDIEITIELGLQTANYKTLTKIHRGHGLAEFIDSVMRIKKYDFPICAHVILNLPWDDMEDCIETAKILSALQIEMVKLHSLYLVKNTLMAEQYEKNEFELIDCEEYKERVIMFLRHIHKDMVVQRIMARAPEEETLFANWGRSWWIIKEEIEARMLEKNWKQGDLCHYLNGPALNVFHCHS